MSARVATGFALWAATTASCVSCSSTPTQPLVRQNPQLTDIRLVANTLGFEGGGGVRIQGVLAASTPTLAINDAVPVTVRIGPDSTFEVLLTASLCEDASGALHSCRVLGVGIATGHSVLELAPRLPEIGGIFTFLALDGTSGSIAFASETLTRAISRVRRWPAVRFVEPDYVFQLTGVSQLGSGVAGVLPACLEGVVWRIPCLEFAGRSNLVLEYHQPDGSTLQRTVSLLH